MFTWIPDGPFRGIEVVKDLLFYPTMYLPKGSIETSFEKMNAVM